MKMNIRKNTEFMTKSINLIFAIVFGLPMIAWIIIGCITLKNFNLVKNGTHTFAIVTDYSTNVTVNDEPIYKLEYVFIDEYGESHTGKTSSNYTYKEATRIKFIEICYNPETFDSIQADYEIGAMSIPLWLLPIFGLVSVGSWIAFFRACRYEKKAKIALEIGTKINAKVLSIHGRTIVNGTQLFAVKYQYEDEIGRMREEMSKQFYLKEEAEKLLARGFLPIKYYNGVSAVIEENIDVVDEQITDNNIEDYSSKDIIDNSNKKRCQMCGSSVDKKLRKCPNCGSNKFE